MMDNLFVFVASLVKQLILAETLIMLLVGLALLASFLGHLRGTRILLSAAFLAVLVIGVLPIGQGLLLPLEQQFPPTPPLEAVDGIVLLGGAEDVGPSTEWSQAVVNELGDRYLAAISLAHRFPEAKVLVTGAGSQRDPSQKREASIGKELLRAAGIAPDRLLLETEARNTSENARLSRELLGQDSSGQWVLVTSAFHMPRAVASFCAAGWTGLVPWPTDYRTSDFWRGVGWDLAGHLEILNTGIKEWVGLLAYRLTGRAGNSIPEGCITSDSGPGAKPTEVSEALRSFS